MANLAHITRLLLVEDEALILLDVADTLQSAGIAEVVTAASVPEALAALDHGRFDAAVTDLHLGRSGWSYDVARKLTAEGIPFVFMSGTAEVADGFRTVPLITKPFSPDQLIAALLQVTAGRQTEAAQ